MRNSDRDYELTLPRRRGQMFSRLAVVLMTAALTGCNTVTTNQYEATALVSLTWQVKYSLNLATDKNPRIEKFVSTSLLNRNGVKPQGAVIGPDEHNLWWPTLPPQPTAIEIEQRKRSNEQASTPEMLRNVKYQLSYSVNNQAVTLPTNYDVYREAVNAHASQRPLQLTLGVNNSSVQKAEPR